MRDGELQRYLDDFMFVLVGPRSRCKKGSTTPDPVKLPCQGAQRGFRVTWSAIQMELNVSHEIFSFPVPEKMFFLDFFPQRAFLQPGSAVPVQVGQQAGCTPRTPAPKSTPMACCEGPGGSESQERGPLE